MLSRALEDCVTSHSSRDGDLSRELTRTQSALHQIADDVARLDDVTREELRSVFEHVMFAEKELASRAAESTVLAEQVRCCRGAACAAGLYRAAHHSE